MRLINSHLSVFHPWMIDTNAKYVAGQFFQKQKPSRFDVLNDLLADIFVVECVVYIIRKAKVVGGIVDFCIDNDVLLLRLFFFVESDEGSKSQVCNGDYGVVIHNSVHSLESEVSYVLVLRKDQ